MINQIMILFSSSIKPEIMEEASVFELDGTYAKMKTIFRVIIPILIVVIIYFLYKIKNKKD